MEQLKIKITGTSPLMMHADTLANPLAAVTKAHKELTSKRKKTDDDHLAIARSEFVAGCYWSAADGFFVPGQNLDATFLGGAKLQKNGVRWKRGALVLENKVKLLHDGPDTPDALWENPAFVDCRGVKVGAAKLMRYRPIFLNWAAELSVTINTEVLDMQEARKAIEDGGALIGTCEYRPRFGRFEVRYV
ncbi:hypothetical protein [Acidovorax sp. SD340]|uniref:hypothetical protein n=1 Tax=Acidovorax sp. SD340 TaxID=1690268 RepID=UPI0006DC1250|nr:hypothetical protein [Acidovorax sp. SD340]KQB59366.1 hypothetical protein AE621_10635 [Acidovorax sp. SD340]MBO1007088.1 hypothetical protein [Acidovorax sp. SD340]